ncbi:MAG: ATP-binding cassette domain-containing protein [Bacillota bacterium]|nr:ATP-binding cassette domain-containing protein [Bacillota bacterium]
MSNSTSIVIAQKLTKNYGDLQAVKGIDFSVQAGQCCGILGPNGAGKTTTVAMLYCFLPVTSGKLEVVGLDVKLNQRLIKSRLGVVPQDDNLDLELSVLENLVIYAGYFGINKEEARLKAMELLAFFQLTEKKNVAVEQLSGGMKRRLALARGLINNPELLILDEPTTGLDPEARHIIWQHLRLLKQQGLTIILTTHYLEEASQLCDQLFIIDQGEIIESGAPTQLVEKHIGKYVIELELPPEERNQLIIELHNDIKGQQLLGSTLFLYLMDSEQAIAAKLKKYPKITYQLLRPANLEDVFLKLTGRGLSGD